MFPMNVVTNQSSSVISSKLTNANAVNDNDSRGSLTRLHRRPRQKLYKSNGGTVINSQGKSTATTTKPITTAPDIVSVSRNPQSFRHITFKGNTNRMAITTPIAAPAMNGITATMLFIATQSRRKLTRTMLLAILTYAPQKYLSKQQQLSRIASAYCAPGQPKIFASL
jgi:hypothetical protein